jgi:hypothetical protein
MSAGATRRPSGPRTANQTAGCASTSARMEERKQARSTNIEILNKLKMPMFEIYHSSILFRISSLEFMPGRN